MRNVTGDHHEGFTPTLAEETTIWENDGACPKCIEDYGAMIGTMEPMQNEVGADGRLLCECDSCFYRMRLLPRQAR